MRKIMNEKPKNWLAVCCMINIKMKQKIFHILKYEARKMK